MKEKYKFYIGERNNPQLDKPYYKAYGQLSIRSAKQKEKSIYGSMILTSYDTVDEYSIAILKLNEKGLKVIL